MPGGYDPEFRRGGNRRYTRDYPPRTGGMMPPYGAFGGWLGGGYAVSPFLMGFPAFPEDLGWSAAPYGAFWGGPYDRDFRRPPEESPNYGRGGDRAARQYLRERGYDQGYSIPPRNRGYDWETRRRDGWQNGRRYDRGYRR